jgi:formate hydrogenlyase subunit 6/NADH:ubiquinone oxidoreductase subunit I
METVAMAVYYATKKHLSQLLKRHPEGSTFVPAPTQHLPWVDAADSDASLEALSQPRAAQSFKGFFLPATESVARYGPESSTTPSVETGKMVLVGVRACELRARTYLDKVMLEGDFESPDYRARREGTTIVSCDCVDCTESCCCTLVGGQPFPKEGFDVNLTPLDNAFLVDVATQRGQEWVGDLQQGALVEADHQRLTQRDDLRMKMVERLLEQNTKFTFSADDMVQPKLPNDEDEGWQKFAADCVECGACTNICPTCHCFYLYDQVLGPKAFERVRTWDSCLLSTYHRMAGGVNMKLTPRPNLLSRLANRVLHKFSYSPEQYGMLGCVGCGRCIDACLGAIDIREVSATPLSSMGCWDALGAGGVSMRVWGRSTSGRSFRSLENDCG